VSWLRLYDEVVDDPKVQKLQSALFKSWVNCLCIAKKHGGQLPPVEDVAYRLHVSIKHAEEIIQQLMKAELFEEKDGIIVPHNWDRRQFESDTSRERTRKWRAKRHGDVTVTAGVTDQSQSQTTEQIRPPIVPQGTYSDDFEKFWIVYPKKVGKGEAFKIWKKNGHPTIDEICAVIEIAKRSPQWLRDHGQYIPNPATWLNQKRWDDDYKSSQKNLDIIV
jgi:hypothetical protein